MTTAAPMFDQSFLDRQSRRLLGTRRDLMQAIEGGRAENVQLSAAASGGAEEMEESAQDLTLHEENRTLGARHADRLVAIDRALARIADGTYGVSLTSGETLPRERLEALPEAESEAE
jgi:DnaK suppressor protein